MRFKPWLLAFVLAVFSLPMVSVQAQTIASKVENQGDSRYVKVSGLMARERNGFMALQMELTNSDYEPQRIFWRVKWLDEAGFQVWDDEPWKPVLMQGSAKQNLQLTAPTPKAKDFRIQFNAEKNWRNDPSSNQSQ